MYLAHNLPLHLPSLAFLNLGPWEIALILFLALLLFGGKKLPGLAKDLGEGIREFRRSLSPGSDEESKPAAPPVQYPTQEHPAPQQQAIDSAPQEKRTRAVKTASKAKAKTKAPTKRKA